MGGALRATAVGFISVLSRLPSHPVNTKANSRAMILIRVIYSSCARDSTMAMSDLISAISAPSPHRGIGPVNGTRSTMASEYPAAIIERFTLTADGEFEPLVEGSTKPVAQTRRHAGIVKVLRFACQMS